uniref:Uncharacterized protein n=1 Tax=Arundo donax TaxID=35708 RepID=A0A0A9EJY3_ARUDO
MEDALFSPSHFVCFPLYLLSRSYSCAPILVGAAKAAVAK